MEPIIRSYIVTRQQAHQLPEPPSLEKQPKAKTPLPKITITPPTPPPKEETKTETPVELDPDTIPTTKVNLSEVDGHVVSTLQMSPAFKKDLINALKSNKQFSLIYQRLCKQVDSTSQNPEGPDISLHNFQLQPRSRLLYYTNNKSTRLVIPAARLKRILRIAHDDHAHVSATRTHQFLRDIIFFPHMRREVNNHIKSCPVCGIRRPSRQLPFSDLQPIETPQIPLSALCLNFIISLPYSTSGNDYILLIVCKTSKFIRGLVRRSNYTAKD